MPPDDQKNSPSPIPAGPATKVEDGRKLGEQTKILVPRGPATEALRKASIAKVLTFRTWSKRAKRRALIFAVVAAVLFAGIGLVFFSSYLSKLTDLVAWLVGGFQ